MGEDTYQVAIVRYGTRDTVKSEVYLNYGLYQEPDEPVRLDYFLWIVRNRFRTVLVDLGYSPAAGLRRARTTLVEPAEAYAAFGVTPETSPTVVITHAHYDHIGNLGLFTSSPVVMSKTEYDFWTGPMSERSQFSYTVETEEMAALRAAGAEGRVQVFSGSMEVAPGIEAIEIGGHSPGLSMVRVQTDEGPVLLASDAIHYYDEYEYDRPFGIVTSLEQMYAGFDRVRAMFADGAVRHLVPGHDPETLSRFQPLADAPSGFETSSVAIGRID